MIPQMFWRVHWRDCTAFSAENAQSIDWGLRGQGIPCSRCRGRGFLRRANGEEDCAACDGAGTVTAEPARGYSCAESREQLVRYFSARVTPADDEPVVIFGGRVVGHDTDGYPLVIPSEHPRPRWTTWGRLMQRKE